MDAEAKLDLYKLHKAEYAAPKKPALVEIQPATYLSIQGRGAPERLKTILRHPVAKP